MTPIAGCNREAELVLRPEHPLCRAQVLKPGRTLFVSESDVFAIDQGRRSRVAKLIATIAVVRSA